MVTSPMKLSVNIEKKSMTSKPEKSERMVCMADTVYESGDRCPKKAAIKDRRLFFSFYCNGAKLAFVLGMISITAGPSSHSALVIVR